MADTVRKELVQHLPQVFDEPAPTEVQQAAIGAMVTTEIKDLGAYLADLIMAAEWTLRRSAWQACDKLGLKRTPRQQAAFVSACHHGAARAVLGMARVGGSLPTLRESFPRTPLGWPASPPSRRYSGRRLARYLPRSLADS